MKKDGNVVKYLYQGHQAVKVVFKDSDVLEEMNDSKQEKKGNKRGASRNEKAK